MARHNKEGMKIIATVCLICFHAVTVHGFAFTTVPSISNTYQIARLSSGMQPRARKYGRVLTSLRGSLAPVQYGELQHCGVLVDDVETALKFYIDVLCMKDVSHLRPNLDYPGAFLECGINQIHLMKLPSMDPREGRPEHGGRDRHLAVTVADIDVLAARLTDNGVKFTMSKSGRRALFCRDPYMNAIEFVEDKGIKAA